MWQTDEPLRITADGASLEAQCFGPSPNEADTIVLLHEGLGCVALWRDFPQALVDAGLPPAGHLVMIRCDSADAAAAERFLHELRRHCSTLPEGVTVIGPLPSALPRRAGKFRFQLTLLASSRGAIHQATNRMIAAADALRTRGDLRWSVDVDATEVM